MICKKCKEKLWKLWAGPPDKNTIGPITSHMVCLDCGIFYKLDPVEVQSSTQTAIEEV